MAFGKINGAPVVSVLFSSVSFLSGKKNYTWQKKESLYPFKTVQKAPVKKIEDQKVLGIGQKSNLKKLRTTVELKAK